MDDYYLSSLPVLKSFQDLQTGNKVYSKKYGLGVVYSLYENDQIIVQFSNLRRRFSFDEEEISRIPDEHLKKQKSRVEVNFNGQKMSLSEFKRRRIAERKRKRELC